MTREPARTVGEEAPASADLLISKLAPPALAPGTAEHARLLDLLSAAASKRLTVVDAPAGYGKTTLLAQWHRRLSEAGSSLVAWLTLERSENDPALFWRYIVGALRSAGSPAGDEAETMLHVPGVELEVAVRSLLNDLVAAGEAVTLILDDYHLVGEPACHELLAYLIRHAPPETRLVIATRAEPPLPLASLRAAGQLAEVGERELRLTASESATYVRLTEGMEMTDDELALLTGRTEGWIAAMHLAVLWLRGEPDHRAALVQFAGDNRHLVDYLGEQVLAGLDAELERFLLETSILTRFNPPLCDAVTGRPGSADALAEIERANLFLVPLDGRREWFRYHHLFGGLLQAELEKRDPALAPVLHRRAFAWHRDHGTVTEAVHHAIHAGDYHEAAEAISSSWITLIRSGRSATVQRWLRRFPDHALTDAPELGYVGAFVAALGGATEAEVAGWLDVAERATAASGPPSGRMADGTTSWETNVNIIRAAFTYRDIGEAATLAERVVAEERGGGQWRVPAFAALAFLRYAAGDPAGARAAADEALADRDAPQRPHGSIHALATLSLLECDDGDAERAGRTATRALDLAAAVGLAMSVTAGLAHVALGRSLVVRRRVDDGLRELELGASVLEGRTPVSHQVYALLALGEAQRAGGDLVAAHRSADAAELLIDSFTDAGVLPAMLAELRDDSQLRRKRRAAAPGTDLSEAELAVLRLLAGPGSRRDIAAELGISANTVKTHTSSIYRKLEAGSRSDAVQRATELKLI